MLLLLSCWIIAGITAEDPATRHYRVKNSSLCLRVGQPPPYQVLSWLFHDNAIVLNQNITQNYRDKVDYNPKDHTLCINKLNETDSGIYKVSFFDSHLKRITESHKLIVQEAVPRPVIRMSVLHSNLSAGFCNITVNCSIQDDWVWSVCDGDGCTTPQRSIGKVNITISTANGSVVCSGSNHVSTSNVSESTEATCFIYFNPEDEETSEPSLLTVIIIVTTIVIALCTFIVHVANGLCSQEHNHQAQTSPAQLIQSQPGEAQVQPVCSDSTSSSSQAEAAYENVDAMQPSQTSSPNISPREEPGSKQSQKVDTIYCLLEVPNETSSLGKSDGSKAAKRDEKIRAASNSRSVTLDEAEQHTQIDTVYSVLQKPKNLQSQHHQ